MSSSENCRRRKHKEKELPPTAIDESSGISDSALDSSCIVDYSTSEGEASTAISATESEGTQQNIDFETIVENIRDKLSDKGARLPYGYRWDDKARHFWFVVYPESADPTWLEYLTNTGLAFCVSELHDKDVDAHGKPKKPHYHVIVSYGNSTTYHAACQLMLVLHSPYPQQLKTVNRAYRYHRHADDPDKYQYKTSGTPYNGWTVPLEATEIYAIVDELIDAVYWEDCREITELYEIAADMGANHRQVFHDRVHELDRVVRSYRNSPNRALRRRIMRIERQMENATNDEERAQLQEKSDHYQGMLSDILQELEDEKEAKRYV